MGCSTKSKCLVVSPSDLKYKIIIEQPTETTDSQGGFTTTWATLHTIWAAINPVKNWENAISLQNETRTTHKITIRYVSGLTNKMRVNFGGRYFNINSILNPEEANIRLDIMATEGLAT